MDTHETGLPVDLIKALVKAQADVTGAVKDSTNPHFQSKYASLESVIDAIRGPLNKNGMAFVQLPYDAGEGRVGLETVLYHTSGQSLFSKAVTPLPKQTPQGVGDAITYLRRYSLMAMVGIAPVDDDGEGNEGRGLDSADQKKAREEGARGFPDKKESKKPSQSTGKADDISEMSDDDIRAEVGGLLHFRCLGDATSMRQELVEFTAFANVPGAEDVEDMVVGQPKWTRKRLENVLRQARKQWKE